MLQALALSFFLLNSAAVPSRADVTADAGKSAAEQILLGLRKLGTSLPKSEIPGATEAPLLAFVRLDPSNPWTLGVLRVTRIGVPAAKMISVVENISSYVGLFKDLLEVKSTPLPGKQGFVLYTETRIPLPFLANDRTSVRYRSERSNNRRLLSFALVESNHLSGLNGASLLIPSGKKESTYWQLNFVKVGFGPARALPPRMFWVENALGGVQADWALKLKAEQPELKPEEILQRSQDFSRSQEAAAKAAFETPITLEQLLARLSAPQTKAHAQ